MSIKRHLAALKAWDTCRKNQRAKNLSERARKAWVARRSGV